jgi:hypothetical protein
MIIITIYYLHLGIGSRRPIEALDSPNYAGHVGFGGSYLNTKAIFSGPRWALVKWVVSGWPVGLT